MLTGGFLTTGVPKTSTNTFSLHNNPVRQACKDVSHFKDKDSEVSWVNEVPGEPVKWTAGPGHMAAESGSLPSVSEARVESEGQSVSSHQPPYVLDLSTHIHIHVHTVRRSYSDLLQVTVFWEEGERGQNPEVVRGRWVRMSGLKLKAREAPRAEGSHPATLRGSLAVSDDIRSNHPKLWSQGAQAVSWNKNQLHTHRYTDTFWKLREVLISLLWPNIFSFKRLWIAPESTVSSPESIRTASYSFLPSIYLAGRGLVAGCRGHRVPCGPHYLSGPGTEAGTHLWQSSLMPRFSLCHCQVS